jgi:hypothetical protein
MNNTDEPQEPPVNLDAYGEPDDLMAFWQRHNGRSINAARELFPDRPHRYVRTARDLANYASNKATAMRCRARGDIATAQMYEGICERIYDALPAYARW